MSYLVNTAVPYTASAVTGSTGGLYDGPYTYAWTFDDSTNGTGSTYNKTWTTAAYHTGTVTATNTTTGQTATNSVTINIINPAAWAWHDSTVVWSNNLNGWPYPPVFTNQKTIVSVGQGSDPTTVYVYTPLGTATTPVTGITAGLGTNQGLLTTGIRAGQLLWVGGDGHTTTYGFYNPETQTYTNSGKTTNYSHGSASTSMVRLANGKFLAPSDNSSNCEIYDPVADAWTPTGSIGATSKRGTLRLCGTGRVLLMNPGSSSTRIYDPSTNTWSAGPTLAGSVGLDGDIYGATMGNGKILIPISGSTNVQIYDDSSQSLTSAASYPLIEGGAISNTSCCLVTLEDGKVLDCGGFVNNGTLNLTKTATRLYDPVANTWSILSSATGSSSGFTFLDTSSRRVYHVSTSGTKHIYYSDPW